MLLLEQELLSLPENLISSPVRGAQYLGFCVLLCRLLFGLFVLWHCIVCSYAVYGFSLFLWYLQALHIEYSYRFQLNIHIAIEKTLLNISFKQKTEQRRHRERTR